MIGPLAEAVREADRLDADIALGRIESSAARAVQNEARAALRGVVDRKGNLGKAAEALTARALVVVQAEQERLQETAGQELSQVDAEIAKLDQRWVGHTGRPFRARGGVFGAPRLSQPRAY